MKYAFEAVKYAVKNLKYLVAFVVVPAVLLGCLSRPFLVSNFLGKYPGLVVNNYMDVFGALFDFSWQNVLVVALALALGVVSITLVLGFVERHMRTGAFTFHDSGSVFNNNILTVSLYLLLMFVMYVVAVLVLSLVVFWLHLVVSGLGATPSGFSVTLAYVLALGILLAFARVAMYLMLSIPESLTTGSTLSQSVREVNENLSHNAFVTYLAFALPLVIIVPLIVASVGQWWTLVVAPVAILLCLLYYPALMYVVHFDVSSLTRYDVSLSYPRLKR